MNPLQYAQMMKYLTRAKKAKPDLPDVFRASEAPIPPKTQTVEEMEAINEFMLRNPRVEKAGGGMLVQPSADGSRPGYKDKTGPKSKKTEEAEKAIQKLLDEKKEITTKNILDNMPKKIVKEGVADSVLTKAKKQFKNLDFKRVSSFYIKAPKEVAAVKRLIEDGLPLKEIQAKGFSIKFIKNVAKNSELKIAETGYEYYKNIQKITKDLTKIGNNNKIKQAFEKGTVSKELLNDVAKITKSKDPFYDSRLLFKLAEYYDGTLESWYKPKILKITDNQKINANKVIQTSSIFQGGKRSGYAYQSNLYDWGAKQIDQALDLPLGTFRNIQKDIAKTLPSGISLDEVFGVKSSGRYAPIEGVLTNPLESKINVSKGDYVDNVKSAYQKQLIDAAGDPKKQKQILKEYNETISKSKVRYPDVEFPNYEVGKSPNKTIKNFGKLPPLIQKQLLDNYKKTGIAPTTKKAVNIFDIAKATDSPTFSALDKKTQVKLTSKKANILSAFCNSRKKLNSGSGSLTCSIKEVQTNMKKQINEAARASKDGKIPKRFGKLRAVASGFFGDVALPLEYMFMAPDLVAGDIDGALRSSTAGLFGAGKVDLEQLPPGEGRKYIRHQNAITNFLNNYQSKLVAEDQLKNLKPGDEEQFVASDQLAQAEKNMADIVKDYQGFGYTYQPGEKGLSAGKVAAQKLIRDKVTSDFDKKIDKGASTEFFKDSNKDLLKENLRSLGGDPFTVTPINNLEDYIKNKGEATAGNTNIFFNRLPYTLEQAEAYGVPDIFNTYAGGYAGVETPGSMEKGQEIDMGIKDVRDAYSSLPINMASQLADLEKKEFEEGMLKRRLENQLFAGGGIAKEAGVSSGPAPTSGPDSQGLPALLKHVRNR